MKNQNDLIFAIAAAVVTIGVVIAMIFMARKPATVPQVEQVPLAEVAVPAGTVVYSNSLPNAGSGSSSSSGFGTSPGGPGGGPAALGKSNGSGNPYGDGPVASGTDSL